MPQRTKEPHHSYSFDYSANEGANTAKAEDLAKEAMILRVYTVQNNGDMRPELGNNVECTYQVGLR